MVLIALVVFWGLVMWWLGILSYYLVVLGLLTVGSLIGAGIAWVGRKLQIRIND